MCMGRYSEDTGVLLGQGLPSVRHGAGAPSGGWPMFKVHSNAGCSSATPYYLTLAKLKQPLFMRWESSTQTRY